MRRLVAIALAGWLVLAGAGLADTVYLRSGKKLVGKVTKIDGKYRVDMGVGVVDVDEADVLYVAKGGATRPALTTGPSIDVAPVPVRIRPAVVWNINDANTPEPIVFMLARRRELLLDDPASGGLGEQVKHWQISVHDGKRKLGAQWITRDQQRHRRTEYEKRLRKAEEITREVRSLTYSRKAGDAAKRKRLTGQAIKEMEAAVRGWPDPIMQSFLQGVLELRKKNYLQAEVRFRKCTEAEPLVAGFRQGRGIALLGLERPLDALAEFIACLQLRDDSGGAIDQVEKSMKEVPGAKVGSPIYRSAQALLERYEKPDRAYRSYGRGVAWLMPGRRPWQARGETLFTPPCDRVVTRQALGVPITDSALLVDEAALAGAELVYVQLTDDLLVRAYPKRRTYGYGAKKLDLPISAVIVPTATFTPVEMEKPAPLKAGQRLTIRAANSYRVMGTEIRIGAASVVKADKDGVTLDGGVLPGEPLAAAFADKAFAGFLTGRTDPEADGCGKSTFIKPADLTAYLKKLKGTLRYSPYRSWSGPKLKEDAPKHSAGGRVFLVYVLLGDKPPAPVGK